ncbi:MAG: amidohydrolase family protein [Actinomycetales bacterium]|nr:amidohydrolase family protein [Actinomycetales bacterium]
MESHQRTVSRRAFTLGALGVLAACSPGQEGPGTTATTTSPLGDGTALSGPVPTFSGELPPLVEQVTVPPDLPETAPTLFRGVRLFDGESITEEVDVILAGGLVTSVGTGLEEPEGAEVVDGAGHTLIPGMIDSHVHAYPEAQQEAARFGVLTELDLFVVLELADQVDEQRTTGATGRADVFSATSMATAPDGHGTQFRVDDFETLTEPSQAAGWVADRVAEGAAYIKIVIESGGDFQALDQEIVAALVEAAHEQGLRAIIHAQSAADTVVALSVPLDGLAHAAWDELPPEVVARIAEMGIPVVTTAGMAQPSRLKPALDDDRVADRATPVMLSRLRRATYAGDEQWAAVLSNLRALHDAGVSLLTGTDNSNPGTISGIGILVETEILVEAGMTPVEALASATSLPADTFGLADRGRIAEGLRGDVVLVEGDPTTEITDLHGIVGVWKWGVPVELDAA